MIAFPEIRYHYQQAVESVVIKKSIEVITTVAFHTFHILKYGALVPAAITSMIIGVPLAIINICLLSLAISLHKQAEGIVISFRHIDTLKNSEFNIPSILQQVAVKVHSIADPIIREPISLTMVAWAPFIAVTESIDFIEDIGIKITQIVLDTLTIPVKLCISRKKLLSILTKWERSGLPKENRRKACEQIVDYYDRSNKLLESLFPSGNYLYLNDCELRSLPPIFVYKPFSHLHTLNNHLSSLQTDIFKLSNYDEPEVNEGSLSDDGLDFPISSSWLGNGISQTINQLYRDIYQTWNLPNY